MAERLRALLEDPLDASVARAALALAAAALLGFAAVAALGLAGAHRGPASDPARPDSVASRQRGAAAGSQSSASALPPPTSSGLRRQDPQDRPGSPAHRRARRELAGHRALQHLPYRRNGLSVALVGARGDRAIVRVGAPTVAAARRGWRSFLRRYRDPGAAYLPVFVARRRKSRGEGS